MGEADLECFSPAGHEFLYRIDVQFLFIFLISSSDDRGSCSDPRSILDPDNSLKDMSFRHKMHLWEEREIHQPTSTSTCSGLPVGRWQITLKLKTTTIFFYLMILWVKNCSRVQLDDSSIPHGINCGHLVMCSIVSWAGLEDPRQCHSQVRCIGGCGGLNNAPQRYPGPNPWDLRMIPCMVKALGRWDSVKNLKWVDYPELSRWTLHVIRSVLIRGMEIWLQKKKALWQLKQATTLLAS